jgi:ATP-dependent Clp protease ATP-binding subunit ClpB
MVVNQSIGQTETDHKIEDFLTELFNQLGEQFRYNEFEEVFMKNENIKLMIDILNQSTYILHGGKAKRIEIERQIVDKLLNILKERLKEEYISIEFTKNINNYVIDNSFSLEYGARPVKRFIQREIETLLAKAIIRGDIDKNRIYTVDCINNEIVIK